jgi:hypothetical protein
MKDFLLSRQLSAALLRKPGGIGAILFVKKHASRRSAVFACTVFACAALADFYR